ncbi:MAG TPA: hypothetical protein VF177_12310 [Anaerolineae bacterium]
MTRFWMLVLLALLAACGGSGAGPISEPAATAPIATAPMDEAAIEAGSEAAPTEVANQLEAATSPAGMNGGNDDGTFYRGSPDAPVTLIEYSDFL